MTNYDSEYQNSLVNLYIQIIGCFDVGSDKPHILLIISCKEVQKNMGGIPICHILPFVKQYCRFKSWIKDYVCSMDHSWLHVGVFFKYAHR